MVIKMAMAGIGVGVGMGAIYGTVVETLRSGITWAKWKALKDSIGYPRMAEVMQCILGADKDEVHGISTKGMIDTMWKFVDTTVDMSLLMGEQIANQLFVQMIQQSVAYAIHTSHAGAIGTVCNVYSGSQSLSPMVLSNIGEHADLADRGVKGFLSASTGLNIPSTAFELMRGVNTRINAVYQRIIIQAEGLLDEWNDLGFGYYRHYHTMARNRLQDALEMKESIVTRAYGFLEQVVNEHLARISEQLDTLEGAKAWYDAGLMSSEELEQISIRVNIERGASEGNFDDYKTEVLEGVATAVSEWDAKVDQALSDLKDCEYRYSVMFKSVFSALFSDVSTFVSSICDEVNKTVEDVCAYRNIKQAVTIGTATELGSFESSPEEEVYRLRWKRWTDITQITSVSEVQYPTNLPWRDATAYEKKVKVTERATVVPRRRFEEKDFDVIVPYTEPTPLIPWESVG